MPITAEVDVVHSMTLLLASFFPLFGSITKPTEVVAASLLLRLDLEPLLNIRELFLALASMRLGGGAANCRPGSSGRAASATATAKMADTQTSNK